MSGSVIQITYDDAGTPLDITDDVIFEDATFEQQMNAVPGTFSFRVHDPSQSYDFITGREIRLLVDNVPLFGGYLMRVSMTYPFSADNTSSPGSYQNRIWRLEGVDYNILFDNRIIRKTTDYTTFVPSKTGYAKTTMDGQVLRLLLSTWSDFPSGFDITTQVDDIVAVLPSTSTVPFIYQQQGTKLRSQFDNQAAWANALFYISADKTVHYHTFERVQKRWGFSDDPNYAAISTSSGYQNATYGFREVSGTEDGTLLVNDALIWGGASPASEDVLFARYQDAVASVSSGAHTYVQEGAVTPGSSIDVHGRWQIAETHFGESNSKTGLGILSGVKQRANQIINGPPGGDPYGSGVLRGLRYPQWSFEFTWFASHVPLLSGSPDHIVAGDLVTIDLDTFGVSEMMPCRTVRITFPNLDETGKAYVQFRGEFSLQYSDSIALWKTIMGSRVTNQNATIRGVNESSLSTDYGDYGTFTPYESANGSRTLFSIKLTTDSLAVGYIMRTTAVYVNGLLKRQGVDYTETSPTNGTFTFTSPPAGGSVIIVTCRTLEAGVVV